MKKIDEEKLLNNPILLKRDSCIDFNYNGEEIKKSQVQFCEDYCLNHEDCENYTRNDNVITIYNIYKTLLRSPYEDSDYIYLYQTTLGRYYVKDKFQFADNLYDDETGDYDFLILDGIKKDLEKKCLEEIMRERGNARKRVKENEK